MRIQGRWSALALVALGVLAFCGGGAVAVSGQTVPLLLMMDETAIDHGPPPHLMPAEAVNDLIGKVGLREPLPYFAARVGQSLTLRSGSDGNDGWFAIRHAIAEWETEASLADGLENFALAGPGLGSADESGARTTLLTAVPGVVALRREGLAQVVGRSVCAVVYDDDILAGDSAGTDLTGVNLGIIAFTVESVDEDGTPWPNVTVVVQDALSVCGGPLAGLPSAPVTAPVP